MVRAGYLYAVHWTPVEAPPLSEMNWDCFAPKKINVFF
jgi:hypothetical protein